MELQQPGQKYEHSGQRALSQGEEETTSGQPAPNWGALTNLCKQSALHTHRKDTKVRVADGQDRECETHGWLPCPLGSPRVLGGSRSRTRGCRVPLGAAASRRAHGRARGTPPARHTSRTNQPSAAVRRRSPALPTHHPARGLLRSGLRETSVESGAIAAGAPGSPSSAAEPSAVTFCWEYHQHVGGQGCAVPSPSPQPI